MKPIYVKKGVVREVARRLRMPQVVVEAVVDAMADVIIERLGQGQRVVWKLLGAFEPKERTGPLPGQPFGFGPEGNIRGKVRWIQFRPGTVLRRHLRAHGE